jgi:hypothetical protein
MYIYIYKWKQGRANSRDWGSSPTFVHGKGKNALYIPSLRKLRGHQNELIISGSQAAVWHNSAFIPVNGTPLCVSDTLLSHCMMLGYASYLSSGGNGMRACVKHVLCGDDMPYLQRQHGACKQSDSHRQVIFHSERQHYHKNTALLVH